MSFAKVTYPPPPPTYNTLTLHERNQFMRSTKKIGKVLGSTPHLDDSYPIDPVFIRLSTLPLADKPHLEIIDSPVSGHSSQRPGSSSSYSTMSSESTDTRTSISSSQSGSSFTETVNSADSWRARRPTRKPPPLLRLTSTTVSQSPPSTTASVKPTLETIPGTPPFEAVAGDKPSGPQQHTMSFTAFSPPGAPSFDIPSEATMRRAKMERLKRKLGDEVPAHLVFPSDDIEFRTFNPPISTDTQSATSDSRPISSTDESLSSKVKGHAPRSSFSLERPLFAIVEGPEDHVSGCFDFGSRKERVAPAGRRRG